MIWVPHLGLKGQVDVTVRCRVGRPPAHSGHGQQHNAQQHNAQRHNSAASWGPEVLAPLELKTGKFRAELEHRAQLILYTVMLAERHGAEVPIGALWGCAVLCCCLGWGGDGGAQLRLLRFRAALSFSLLCAALRAPSLRDARRVL